MFKNMEEKARLVFDASIEQSAEEGLLLAVDLASVIEAQPHSALAILIALFMVKAVIKDKIVQTAPKDAEEMRQVLDRLEEMISKNAVEHHRAFVQMTKGQSNE